MQIGNNIEVKSKVIKKEKSEVKYADNIASGNAAIFVCQDPENENRIIINMGNIPPKNDKIFISKFFILLKSHKNMNLNYPEIYIYLKEVKIFIKTRN